MKLPQFVLPPAVAKIGGGLPQWPPTLVLVTALNVALGRWLPREPLEPLIGKRFAIKVLDAGLTLRFSYGGRAFYPSSDAAPADLTISAKSRDFIALLAREEDSDSLFFSRRLLMEGDTELGLVTKNTLDAVELPQFDAGRWTPSRVLRRILGAGPRPQI